MLFGVVLLDIQSYKPIFSKMTEFSNNEKMKLEDAILKCDKAINKFERDLEILPTKRLNPSHKAHLYELFTMIIKTERLSKLIIQAVIKKTKYSYLF